MSKRSLSFAGIAAVLLFVGGYFASPYWTLHQMQSAARAGEGDRLATYVDFPAVRESLKSQLQAMMVSRLQADSMKNNPFATLGMAIAGGMVSTFVEGMVTPENLARVVISGKANEVGKGIASEPSGDNPSGKPTQRPRIERRYEGVDVFQVEMYDPDTDKLMSTLVLNREGWFAWKLKAVRMPRLTERYVATLEPDAASAMRRAEMQQKKEAENKTIDDAYRERRAKERADKIAEFNADPAKILQGLRKLMQSGRFNEACGMAADFDGVVNDDLRKITNSIESKVGVRCSNG